MQRVGTLWTEWQKLRGLVVAAMIGLALTLVKEIGGAALGDWIAVAFLGFQPRSLNGSLLTLLPLILIFGLPVALITCLLFGYPAWDYLERRNLRTRMDFTRLGVIVGWIIGAFAVAISLAFGIRAALDDTRGFSSWWWGYQVVSDGLPTTLGWLFNFISILATGMIGAVAGFAAWQRPRANAPALHPTGEN